MDAAQYRTEVMRLAQFVPTSSNPPSCLLVSNVKRYRGDSARCFIAGAVEAKPLMLVIIATDGKSQHKRRDLLLLDVTFCNSILGLD